MVVVVVVVVVLGVVLVIIGVWDTRCVSHTVYLAHGNCKDEARGRSRHKSNS